MTAEREKYRERRRGLKRIRQTWKQKEMKRK
jgi:hypothetical protein